MIRVLMAIAATFAAATATPVSANDFPTEARADYVIGCMAANGQTQDAMRRCACSIDAIAAVMPYVNYERAETVLQMRGVSGERTGLFRDAPALRKVVDQLRAAQVEADFRCF